MKRWFDYAHQEHRLCELGHWKECRVAIKDLLPRVSDFGACTRRNSAAYIHGLIAILYPNVLYHF